MWLIFVLAIILLIVLYSQGFLLEGYSQTNYEQIPNYATFPNSLGNAYILNYQYLFPKRVTSISDKNTCKQ
jgi:hypothetical protein